MCGTISVCITGQTVTSVQRNEDLSGDCPAERECYSLYNGCSTTLCALLEGMHCSDPSCNPGDTQIPSYAADCGTPTKFCYPRILCAQSIVCETWRTAACSSTSSDAGILEPQDASAAESDVGRTSCCGDGIVDPDHGEQCDLGPLNGACIDSSGHPVAGCPAGTSILCLWNCTAALPHM